MNFGDEVDRIVQIDVLTGEIKAELEHIVIFPASHYVVDKDAMERAIRTIEAELEDRVKYFKAKINYWRRSVLLSEPILILRCSGKPVFVQVSKIIRGIYRD